MAYTVAAAASGASAPVVCVPARVANYLTDLDVPGGLFVTGEATISGEADPTSTPAERHGSMFTSSVHTLSVSIR